MYACMCEGRSINKLQNGVFWLICRISKTRNIRFVWEIYFFYWHNNDVIIMTPLVLKTQSYAGRNFVPQVGVPLTLPSPSPPLPPSFPSPSSTLPPLLPSPIEVGPLVELGGVCKLPQRGPGQSPYRPRISAQFHLKRRPLVALKSGGTVLPSLESGEYAYPSYPCLN